MLLVDQIRATEEAVMLTIDFGAPLPAGELAALCKA